MKTTTRLTGATLALIVSSTAVAQEPLLWSDEFEEGPVPDPRFWSYDLGASGWGNQELQEYTDRTDNVAVVDGNLRIRVQPQSGNGAPFTSGRIRTEEKISFTYATVEARIKVPNLADGLWPAFWTLGDNFSEVGWPFCGELDILEMGSAASIAAGRTNERISSAAHWDVGGDRGFFGDSLDAGMDLSEDFHILRMEWTPTTVTTFIDDVRIWQIDIREESCTSCEEFHRPHFLLLNVAVGGTFTGIFDSGSITAGLPAEMLVDWVRIYDNGFTTLGGSGLEALGPPDIGPAHSGSWYNVNQSGHGFSLEFGELNGDPLAIAYWYTFDTDGNPIFLVGSGIPDGTGVDISFLGAVGMEFGVFDPGSVSRPSAGTARFDFTDRSNGTFSYTPSDYSIDTCGHSGIDALPITKLFGIPTSNRTFAR